MSASFPVGKTVGGSIYVHRRSIEALPGPWPERIAKAASLLPADASWNVAKLEPRSPAKVSLLDYDPFAQTAFPALRASHRIDLETGSRRTRRYEANNPPILHRKELLLLDDHPDRPRFAALTLALEERGLFHNVTKVGYARRWRERLEEAGIDVIDHEIVERAPPPSTGATAQDIDRHKTAIARNRLSSPMQALYGHGIISAATTVLDYGCGQGDDVRALRDAGVDAVGWDPHHAPAAERRPSAVVNLGFVLNVIEEPDERRTVLREAFALASSCLAVAVMVVGKADVSGLTPYRDGFLTRRRTFQKYFEQADVRSLIAETLEIEPVAVAPGLFFVFKDEILEQRFLLERQQRTPRTALRALPASPRPARPLRGAHRPSFEERFGELITLYAEAMLALGRQPERDELPEAIRERIDDTAGLGLRRLATHAAARVDPHELDRARETRRDDLRVYFALNAFSRRQRYGALPAELQRDVRAFFGAHQHALAAGLDLLYAIADTEQLSADAGRAFDAEIGWLEDDDFFVHRDQVVSLSPLLRAYIGVGQRLAGSVDDAQLFRIHLRSGKLTALEYAGFDDHPLPRLRTRTKIDLRRRRVDVFDYARAGKVQLLYLKSRVLPSGHPELERQRAFDDALSRTGMFDFTGHGPRFDDFAEQLKQHGLHIDGHRLRRRDPRAADQPDAPTATPPPGTTTEGERR